MATLRRLTRRLKDKDPTVRRAAASALGERPFAADYEARKRTIVVAAVGMVINMLFALAFGIAQNNVAFAGSVVIFFLGQCLCVSAWAWKDEDKWMTRRTVNALVDALHTDEDSEVRSLAAWALGLHAAEIRDDAALLNQVILVLGEAQIDPKPIVRSWAAWAEHEISSELPQEA